MSYRREITHKDPGSVLGPLFDRAKARDEFEFACTLLRFRGVRDPGWDPLEESDALAKQLISLIGAPIETSFCIRLLLFLYCHVTEMRDLYDIIGNLLRVCVGERYSMAPFDTQQQRNRRRPASPTSKVQKIAEWAAAADMPEVGELLGEMLVREIRNAFYHSDYILTPDALNISDGEGVTIENMTDRRVEYAWLIPRLELGINTALATVDFTLAHIRSYAKDKVVRGRFASDGSYMDIQLTTLTGYGLTGFRSPPSAELLADEGGVPPAA